MPRDPLATYEYQGRLYGPGEPPGFSVADLDALTDGAPVVPPTPDVETETAAPPPSVRRTRRRAD